MFLTSCELLMFEKNPLLDMKYKFIHSHTHHSPPLLVNFYNIADLLVERHQLFFTVSKCDGNSIFLMTLRFRLSHKIATIYLT